MPLFVDQPAAGALCDPLCLRVEGWADPAPEGGDSRVEVCLDGKQIGTTTQRFVRPDVNHACNWPPSARSGFLVVGHAPEGPFGTTATLIVRVWQGSQCAAELRREVRLIATDHRLGPFGILLRQDFPPVNHREHVYTSGPSQPSGSPELLEHLVRFLGPPPQRVLDVGCGLGWYGRELIRRDYAWHGAEMKPDDCAALESAGLPHTRVSGGTLPFADAAFGVAMAVEVLEHVRDLGGFLSETARVAPGGLFVSVPNAELLAYLSAHRVIPWHMLEADHCNFFTRASLGALLRERYQEVEIGLYSEHPLRTSEGTPLYYHLYAVARHARS
jgi:SAM-dependent methyltransferase